ncbi:hypothetical protein [Oceanicola sp. 502str15]|uniref:hypothetical protein n=1 Tax=Oceanicola sp. 502str15 TaxID=2696061 RepID=UPI0020952433|nr:hypothetical protein [Oceanicola sp. 502str15]
MSAGPGTTGEGRVMVSGADFDAAALPADLDALAIYEVRRADLPRLAGLERLPLKLLELRWISAPDFTDIPLPAGLEELIVWHSPKLRSCAGITRAPGLKRLRWWDTGPLEDASALAQLPGLRRLELSAGMNRKQKLSSLAFLRDLRLEVLHLNGIAPPDLDITPILDMESLRELEVHGPDFELESLAALCARFPAVYEEIAALKSYPPDLDRACERCGGGLSMLWLRRRKFLWCKSCEAGPLARVLDRFAAQVEAARQARGGGVSPENTSKEH